MNHNQGPEEHRQPRSPGKRQNHSKKGNHDNHKRWCPSEGPDTPSQQAKSEDYIRYAQDDTDPSDKAREREDWSKDEDRDPEEKLEPAQDDEESSNDGNMGSFNLLDQNIPHVIVISALGLSVLGGLRVERQSLGQAFIVSAQF